MVYDWNIYTEAPWYVDSGLAKPPLNFNGGGGLGVWVCGGWGWGGGCWGGGVGGGGGWGGGVGGGGGGGGG